MRVGDASEGVLGVWSLRGQPGGGEAKERCGHPGLWREHAPAHSAHSSQRTEEGAEENLRPSGGKRPSKVISSTPLLAGTCTSKASRQGCSCSLSQHPFEDQAVLATLRDLQRELQSSFRSPRALGESLRMQGLGPCWLR